MEKLRMLLQDCCNERLYQIVISNPRRKEEVQKIKIRPVMLKGSLVFQESAYTATQVFHHNRSAGELIERICQVMEQDFKQLEMSSKDSCATVLVGKKGNVTVRKKQTREGATSKPKAPVLEHNRKKQYILEEGVPVGFLQDLGVQTADGRIVRERYDKFKQINRFLEFVEDILPALPKDRTVRIIDFGCGKSYLTFAMYYYLKTVKAYDVDIIGLDLKTDVIAKCNALRDKYGYDGLKFFQGDIKDYEGAESVDMVVTLHACDTATDYALHKAVLWDASVILSVPCCQHEMNRQLNCKPLEDLFAYGLIRERTAALFTDAIRAQIMETQGYDVQILEFIDMEHAPKNIMLRCVRRKVDKREEQEEKYRREKREKLMELSEFLGVQPKLMTLLQE